MIHQVAIKSLPQEWLWCETWCDDASKVTAKTIDLVRFRAFRFTEKLCIVLHFHLNCYLCYLNMKCLSIFPATDVQEALGI